MEVKVDGLDKLLKKLDKLGGNIPKSTQKALKRAGAVIEAGAKNHCPVDTGQLRESIHTQTVDENAVAVGTNVEHGIFVEFGTGPKGDPAIPHTTKEYWRYKDAEGNWHTSHGQPPQPFMRTGFAEGKDKAVDAAKESLEEDVKGLLK